MQKDVRPSGAHTASTDLHEESRVSSWHIKTPCNLIVTIGCHQFSSHVRSMKVHMAYPAVRLWSDWWNKTVHAQDPSTDILHDATATKYAED